MSKQITSEPITQETSETLSQVKETKLLTHVESPDNAHGDSIQTSNFTSTVNEDITIHELKNLMERPTLIRSGTITSSQSSMVFQYGLTDYQTYLANPATTPGFLGVFNFPGDIIIKNPVVRSKISQFCYFKADMKLELKINKPPEVSGCLMAIYVPRVQNLSLDVSNLTIQGLTSYPYKILDYSTDTSLTMSVPYINQYDYFNFEQAEGSENTPANFGSIILFNLQSPLSGTSSASVSYSAFASFENMELRLPVDDRSIGGFVAQSGKVQRIPGEDIMSGREEKCRISLNYNTEEIDNSKVTYSNNETMLKNVLARENIIGKLNYTAGQNADNNSFLGKVRCFPKRPPRKSMGNSADASRYGNAPSLLPKPIQMGSFDYTCNLFARWTGSIEIGIRLLKTKFHYGRIAVVFDPFDRITQENTIGSLLSTNYSMVIDLNAENGQEGGSNYYRIQIPYMNNVGFSSIGNDFGVRGLKGAAMNPEYLIDAVYSGTREVYNPYLRFYALTNLGFLEAASNTVPILLSIKGGDDLELSIPTVNVAVAIPPQVADDKLYAQSGSLTLIPEISTKTKINSRTCNGEVIRDLKELTYRYTPVNVNVVKSPAYLALDNPVDLPQGDPQLGPKYLERSVAPGGVTLTLHRNTSDGFRLSNVEAVGLLFRYLYGGRHYKCTTAERGSTVMARLLHTPKFSGDLADILSNASANNVSTDEFNVASGIPALIFPKARGCFAISPVTGTSRSINGQMVINSNVNNFIEVSRNFYSNRKLISTRSPASGLNSFTDEVAIQIASYSPTKERTLQFSDDAYFVRIGPHIRTSGPNWVKVPYGDPSDSFAWESRRSKAMLSTADLQTDDDTYIIDQTNNPDRQLKCAEINNANVLEAMPSTGGYTFLQAPPCVIFL